MGKASSSKKVARAAGIGGGRTRRGRTPWGYFGIIVLIVLLGVLGTWSSRDRRLHHINSQGDVAPTVGTVWSNGYAVYECGKFAAPIKNTKPPQGITTGNGDGIIHIAPTSKSEAGKNATLGKFASSVGMKLNAGELQVPGGKHYVDGDTCNGKPGHVYVKHFGYIGDTTGQLYNGKKGQLPKVDPRDVRLTGDQELYTIAFVPASDAANIPPPPAYVNTNLQKRAATSTTPSTTVPGSPATAPPTQTTPTTSPTSTTVKK